MDSGTGYAATSRDGATDAGLPKTSSSVTGSPPTPPGSSGPRTSAQRRRTSSRSSVDPSSGIASASLTTHSAKVPGFTPGRRCLAKGVAFPGEAYVHQELSLRAGKRAEEGPSLLRGAESGVQPSPERAHHPIHRLADHGGERASGEASRQARLSGPCEPEEENVFEILVAALLHDALSFGGDCGVWSVAGGAPASAEDAARARASAFCAIRPSAAS